MKHIGVTGTRRGGTAKQLTSLRTMLFEHYDPTGTTLHMGDCIGIDEESVRIARPMGYRIHSHPPKNPTLRAFVKADQYEEPELYLARNKSIVLSVDLLIACPISTNEDHRSGTWQAVHYASRIGKQTVCVFPSGSVIPWT